MQSEPEAPPGHRFCKLCGDPKPLARMRNRQCYDCLNLRRNTRAQRDPSYHALRQQQRDSGADPDKKRLRQARHRQRKTHTIPVRLHLPQGPDVPTFPHDKELSPVILPDWFWYLLGPRAVPGSFARQRVNPSSYDTLLADQLKLQRYRGREYPDTPAVLELDPYGEVVMRWRDPETGMRRVVSLRKEPFQPGDSVLARTVESFKVPRFVRLQGMLKSSVAREGLDSRSALYVDPKFQGTITLELHFDRTGYLVPYEPLVQFEAQLCLSLKPYRGHYVGQQDVTTNRNVRGIGFRSVPQ